MAMRECLECLTFKPLRAFDGTQNVCLECIVASDRRKNRMPQLRPTTGALLKELEKGVKSRGTPDQPALWDSLLHRFGGADGLMDMMVVEMNKARGEGLDDSLPSPAVVQRYCDMFLKLASRTDQLKERADLSGIDEQDLERTLLALAERLMRENPAFLEQVVIRHIVSNDNFRRTIEYALRHGQVPPTIESGEPHYEPEDTSGEEFRGG